MKKTLTLIGALLFFMASYASLPNDVTIYFESPNNWTPTIHAWWWNGSTDINITGNWPGAKMEKVGDTGNLYSYTIKGVNNSFSEFYVIFSNNGNNQLDGKTVDGDNMYFTSNAGNKTFSELDQTVRVYFRSPSSTWDNAKVWAWQRNNNSATNVSTGAFPGNFNMTKVEGTTDYYYYDIPWNKRSGQLGVLFAPNSSTQTTNYYISENNAVYSTGNDKWYYVKVSYSDQTKTDRNIFLQKDAATGLWKATFQAQAEDGWSQFSVCDGNKSQEYSLNDLTLSEQSLSGILVEWPEVKNQNKSHFRLESNKNYTLTWNETTKEVKLSYEGETVYPKTLYVTGQVNGKDWNYDNVVAMEADGDGKFKLNNLDLSTLQGRVNFCANVGSDWNAQRPQFGSDINTPGVKTDDNGIIVDFGNNNSFTGNLVENNAKCKEFKLPNGHYDVTVDMTTTPMTVTFVKNEELKFSWHSESNSITEENGVSTHRGLVHQNPITIKVGSDLNHEYIKLADVKVIKKSSTVALANTDADYEISEANVITFHKPGTYSVTAELPSNTASYHTTAPIQLTALVTAVDPAFSYSTPEPQAFAKSGEYDDVVFTTENTDITADDVTFTFGPATTGWASSYDGFTTNQAVIDEKNNFISSNQLVDGIYTALTSSNYSLDADNGEFTFSFNNLPCSGMYSLTVSPANTDEVDFTPFTINVEVYPTTTNFYTKSLAENKEETTGFNINGIVAASSASDYSGIVTYPILENGKLYMEDYLEFSHIYYPGLYFATVKLYAEGLSSDDVAEPAPKNQVRRAANDLSSDYFDYNYEQTINLSSLTDKQPMVMYVYAEKNGAKTPVSNDGNSEERYSVVTSTDYTVPTGVETIGEEEGVAVYYNLQGVRVENPEHGIYVKVTNGKATKVVL